MWDLLDLFDALELFHGVGELADGVARGDRGAFDDHESHPGPPVPEPPPPRLPDTGWDEFTPEPKGF